MPEHDRVDNADAERRVRKSAADHGQTPHAAAVGGETGLAARAASRKVDLIGLQRTVGNQNAVRTIRSRGRLARAVSRKTDSVGGPLLVQRASFAELMSFWKKQELGQETPTPAPKKGNATPNLGPQVATTASAETQAMNPAIEEPKEAEKAAQNSSPASLTLPTGASHRGSGTPLTSFKGGGSGTPFTSFHAKSGNSGSVALITPSGSMSRTSSSGGSGGFNIATPSADVAGNKTQVKYLETEEARREFQLDINGTIKQGGQPYDTSKMYSKFKGDGFGIYVMGKDGRFFSTSHKIGLFHHSSFLGGGDVAGAGEMKVEGGELKYLTNKSGHYAPGDTELAQTIDALKNAGASGFSTAQLAQALPNNRWKDPYPGGVVGFLTDQPFSGGGSGNKDVVKYGTKSIQPGYGDEKDDSLNHTRQIIQFFVGQAQLGKLRKFNKPNSDFGKSVDDIKALVLAEFGWSDEDTVTYAAVLENWNNNKTIGAVTGTPPMQLQSSVGLTGSSWIGSSPVSATATGSGGSGGGGSFVGSTSGRDWDEELQELLAKNPSPDWTSFGMSPYGGDFVIYDGGGGYRHPTAKDKVLLLKGEKTINEL